MSTPIPRSYALIPPPSHREIGTSGSPRSGGHMVTVAGWGRCARQARTQTSSIAAVVSKQTRPCWPNGNVK
eukprot:3805996-Pyramimonas_sp.AAC.1